MNTKRFAINLIPIRGFFSYSNEKAIDNKYKYITMVAGGPLFTLILILILYNLKSGLENYNTLFISKDALMIMYENMYNFNIFALLITIVPFKSNNLMTGNYISDGYRILQKIKSAE